MSDKYKLLINFLLDNESVTVCSVANHLNIEYGDAQKLIDECVGKRLLTDRINTNGKDEYYVVLENIIESENNKNKENISQTNNKKDYGELLVGATALIAGIAFLCLFLYSCTGRSKTDEPARDFCTDDDYAYISAKSFIRKNLKSPDSAKFSHLLETQVTKYEGCVLSSPAKWMLRIALGLL